MTLKKTAPSKRAGLPRRSDYAIDYAKSLKKDYTRLSHSGRHDLNRLKQAMLLIANDGPLAPEWLDHSLKGEWSDHREYHIGGDFLLIYREEIDWIIFVRAGTHAEFFGK